MYNIIIILGIIILIILIIIIIYYLIINNYNTVTKDTIENFNCQLELVSGKVDFRPCKIYFTDPTDCILYSEYYKKGITQLDVIIDKYTTSKKDEDIQLVKKLSNIRDNKKIGISDCELELTNWKEINNFYNADNIIPSTNKVPIKNLVDYDSNKIDGSLLSGMCFKEIDKSKTKKENMIDIKDNGIISLCQQYPITNIIDGQDSDNIKEYIGIDLALNSDLKYSEINTNVCNIISKPEAPLNINEQNTFIRIKCYMKPFINYSILMTSGDVEFVNYNKINNNFNIILYNNQDALRKLFRYSYDTSDKSIIYSPKVYNTKCYIIEYDNCEHIRNIKTVKCKFSLKDFNMKDYNIGNYNELLDESKIPEEEDNTVDYSNNIKSLLTEKMNEYLSDIDKFNKIIDGYNEQISAINSFIITIRNDKCDIRMDKKLLMLMTISSNNILSYINKFIIELKKEKDEVNSKIEIIKQNIISIRGLISNMSIKIDISDITSRFTDNIINNRLSYIDNISNDDYIYINIT